MTTRAERIEQAARALVEEAIRHRDELNEQIRNRALTGGFGNYYAAGLSGNMQALAMALAAPTEETRMVTCDLYRHGATLGLVHREQSDCVRPVVNPSLSPAAPTSEGERPAEVVLGEILRGGNPWAAPSPLPEACPEARCKCGGMPLDAGESFIAGPGNEYHSRGRCGGTGRAGEVDRG